MVEIIVCVGIFVAVVFATLAWMCWVIADIGDSKDDEE